MADFFTKNFPSKVIALLAAVSLWVLVMNDQNPSTDSGFSIPITVMNAPRDSRITQSEDHVRIKLRGSRSSFASLSPDELKAIADLTGLEAGDHPVHIQATVPHGFELLSLSPEMVTFNVDPRIQKRMDVQLIRVGAPSPGVAIAAVEPETSTVTLIGPMSAVNSVAQVIGYFAIPSGSMVDTHIDVPLKAIGEEGQPIGKVGIVPQNVSVFIQFARGLSKKVVDINPVTEGTLAENLRLVGVTVDPVRIEIAGNSKTLSDISSISTEPVSLDGLTETTKKAAALVLPDGVTVTNQIVNVNIEIGEN